MTLSKQQIEYLSQKGLSLSQVEKQIERITKGTKYLNLAYPAQLEKGIIRLTADEINSIETEYLNLILDKRICKFVPASGAATRMFKDLYMYLESSELTEFISYFIENIEKFAFYQDLKAILLENNYEIETLLLEGKYNIIIDYLLTEKGLNYGNLPKGLLLFHKNKNEINTPIAEHIKEAIAYAGKESKLIFTISETFKPLFDTEIQRLLKKYNIEDISYELTYQKANTDTVAVDLDFNLVSISEAEVLLRPGGHGSLIENLNEVDADIIFIKNIDNVCSDNFFAETVKYKKVITGVLLDIRKRILEYIEKIENYDGKDEKLNTELEHFISDKLNIFSTNLVDMNPIEKVKFYRSRLDRPIRVCGMVKNEGEPGGGPFAVVDGEGVISLQIVESSQIDHQDKHQEQIFLASSHFNPVDIVCSVTNADGEKYDLQKFVDEDAYFIAKKSFRGKDILALEHPGLWNGGMGNWNTIFVEVSSLTFNPVKTVNDLLRKTHQV